MRLSPHIAPVTKIGSSSMDEVASISPHPDGTLVAMGPGLQLRPWPSLGKPIKVKGYKRAVYAPDGCSLFAVGVVGEPGSANARDTIELLDGHTGKPIREVYRPTTRGAIESLVVSPDGAHILACAGSDAIVVDVVTGKVVQTVVVTEDANYVRPLGWHGDTIAVRAYLSSHREAVALFDARTGKRRPGVDDRPPGLGAAFAPDGSLVVALDADRLGSWRDGKLVRSIPTDRPATHVAIAGDGTIAVPASLKVALYTDELKPQGSLEVDGSIYALAFGPGALFAGVDNKLYAWSDRSAKPRVLPPEISVKLAAPRKTPAKVDLAKVRWLGNVGKPLAEGNKLVAPMSAWPGPDAPGVAAFLELIQSIEDDLGTAARLREVELPDVAYGAVYDRVPHDEDADWAEPTNAAALTLGTIARIVERYHAIGWEVPETVATLWAWCLDGRWPCGFARKPGKALAVLMIA